MNNNIRQWDTKLNKMEPLLLQTQSLGEKGKISTTNYVVVQWVPKKDSFIGRSWHGKGEGSLVDLVLGPQASWQCLLIEGHFVQNLGEKAKWPWRSIHPFICMVGRPYWTARPRKSPGQWGSLLALWSTVKFVPEAKKIKYPSNKICWFPSDINQIYNLNSAEKSFHEKKKKRKQHSVQMLGTPELTQSSPTFIPFKKQNIFLMWLFRFAVPE